MREETIKLYKFVELPAEIKEKIITENCGINVDHEWYDSIYDDAANIGLKITGFDIDRGNYCNGVFINSAEESAEKIIKEHGEDCDTYILAKKYLADRGTLVSKHSDGVNLEKVHEDNYFEFDQSADQLDEDFKKSLLEEYLSMLRKEYQYQTSAAAIKETIEVNDYEFTIDGKQY